MMTETDSSEVDSILRWDSERLAAEGGRGKIHALRVSSVTNGKLTCKYCSNPPLPFHRQYIPSVRYAACCKKIGGAVMVLSGGKVKTSIATF